MSSRDEHPRVDPRQPARRSIGRCPAFPCSTTTRRTSLLAAFKDSLERMGGMFLDPPTSGDILAPVRAKIANAKVVCSTVPEIAGNRDIAGVGAPQDLADVDFAIVRAAFAVAETGSVLLSETELRVNALAYLAQHLIVLLDPADIVVNLHHAYRRPEFRDSRYCLFPHRPIRDGGHRGRPHPRRAGRPLAFRPADRSSARRSAPMRPQS